MFSKRTISICIALVSVLALLLSSCTPAATPTVSEAPTTPAAASTNYKLAAILPGVITDADYNTIGYLGATAVQKDLGVQMAYSESVAVPDVERVMREYIDQGFNIIFAHGGQFINQAIDLAKQFPDVTFIGETDGQLENAPANLWIIDRQFHIGYYVLGYIAAKTTTTGKIGYLSGQTLPFSYQEFHAIEQVLKDKNLNVQLVKIWTGDFNDPTKARQVADQMIADNVDVIMGSLNLGMFGVFESAKAGSTDQKKILVTAKYTDKTSFAPNNYITSSLYDFTTPLEDIVKSVMSGQKGGYYPIIFGKGDDIQLPLKNAPAGLDNEVKQMIDDIKSGKIVVNRDSTPVK